MKKVKVFMAMPSTGDRSDAQTYLLRRAEKHYGDRIEFHYMDALEVRIFHDAARNMLVERFLATDCDVMWFLDSDVVPPHNVLDLITEHFDKWELAGAPYPVFMTPPGEDGPRIVYCVYKNVDGKLAADNVYNSGLNQVDGLATGCIFIKREVFSKLQRPYFEFKYEPETRLMVEGEDLNFIKKVNEQGYKFFIDYSMRCRHYKRVDLLEVSDYAVAFANKSVMDFDTMLRSSIAKKRLGVA